MTSGLGYKDLCAAILLNIASFAIGDTFCDLDLDNDCLKRPRIEEFDSDSETDSIPETWSDIDEESDEDGRTVDIDDGFAIDDWYERQGGRQGERHFRRERALENLRDKYRRCREWRQQLDLDAKKAKQDAQSVVTIMSVCKDWRKELSVGGDSYANKKLWKALVRNLFPQEAGFGGICSDNILEKRGYSFFSIFQLMVKISRANDAEGSADKSRRGRKKLRAQMTSALAGVDLEDVIIFMEFEFKSSYGTKHYAGFGGVGVDQIVRVKVPKFGDLVEKKSRAWAKSDCELPIANIFVLVPSKESTAADLPSCNSSTLEVLKIYGGQPEWCKHDYEYEDDVYGEEAGEAVASLFGKNYLTAYGDKCIVVYHYEDCNGAYSDSMREHVLENKDEYWAEEDYCGCDETMLTRLRIEDLKDFLLG